MGITAPVAGVVLGFGLEQAPLTWMMQSGVPAECVKIAYTNAHDNHGFRRTLITTTQILPRNPPGDARIRAARAAIEAARTIRDEASLAEACKQWQGRETLGIDTEFVRERTFHARPGLIQISDGERVWLLDPVALPDMPPLGHMLADRSVTKVLHSVGEDLDVLHAVGKSWPGPLFDTQIAAAMLGWPLQSRYENLVEAAFGVELAGGKARNDWCRRPLAPGLLKYAAEDVVWLPDLRELLETALDEAGRLEWLRQDCERIVTTARAGDQTPPLSRVKGAGRLETAELAFLDALADWRDEQAVRRDLPRRFVLSDESLTQLAQGAAARRFDSALEALGGRQRQRYQAELRERVAAVDADAFERPAWLDALTPDQRGQVKQAQNVVRELAESLGIDPAVIASKKELTRLVRGERPDWLEGWRGRVLAGQLESASVNIPPPPE